MDVNLNFDAAMRVRNFVHLMSFPWHKYIEKKCGTDRHGIAVQNYFPYRIGTYDIVARFEITVQYFLEGRYNEK